MKKEDFYLTLFFAVILMMGGMWFVVASDSLSDFLKGVRHRQAVVRYFCPRHPEVGSSQPGECRVCKMRLVKQGQFSANVSEVKEHNGG